MRLGATAGLRDEAARRPEGADPGVREAAAPGVAPCPGGGVRRKGRMKMPTQKLGLDCFI